MSHDLANDGDRPSSPRSPHDGLSSATIHDLLGFVTTIKSHAQLLQRRLRRTGSLDPTPSAELLVGIDRATTELTIRLNGLRRDMTQTDD
jgi:hypothetical protein